MVEATRNGVLFKVIPKIGELAGIDSKFGSTEEVKLEVESLRR